MIHPTLFMKPVTFNIRPAYHFGIYLAFLLLAGCDSKRLQYQITSEGISVAEGDSPVLFFQVEPKSLNGQFKRAGYVHPLYNLGGAVITEDFPEDHRHQHGIFAAWHQILVGDSIVANGWMGENISWEVAEADVARGQNSVIISGEIVWQVSRGDQVESVAKEIVAITVHESMDEQRIIDYDFQLVSLIDGLQIGGANNDKGYGGFSLRFNLPPDIAFVARDGDVEPTSVPVEAGPWMDMTGSFDTTGKSGILVLSHPSNPGHPQPWILRRQKSMQNPVFPGRHPVGVGGEGLNFRYRLILHQGEIDPSAAEAAFELYSAK